MKLTIAASDHDSGTTVYTLSGNLHGTSEGYKFQDEVRRKFASGTRRVVIDLAEVGRIDSCGIGIIAAVAMSAQNAGAGLVLASLPERIVQILGVTSFLECVDSANSVDEAMTKLDQMRLPADPK